MTDKAKSILNNPIIAGMVGAGVAIGFMLSTITNQSNAQPKQTSEFVLRTEFVGCIETLRKEDREDKQILFGKIDKLTQELSKISQGLARIEGAQNK